MITTPLFGYSPYRIGVADAAALPRLAARADRAGLDLFTVPDHPHVGTNLDAYVAVATVLSTTTRLRAAVNVTNLPVRPAPMLARTLTSLQALSAGRTIFGVGAGGWPQEAAQLGAPARTPRAAVEAMADTIELVRALSDGGDAVSVQRPSFAVDTVQPAPVPAPPVWTGAVGPRSLTVTGRLADGWIPGHAADWHSERYRDSRAKVDEAAVAAGRNPAEIGTYFNVFGRITDRDVDPHDEEGRFSAGSVDQWVAELTTAVREHGASGFLFHAADDTTDDAALARWAEDVAPAVRARLDRGR